MEFLKSTTPHRISDETIISVENVHKKFKVYFDKGSTLKERLLFQNRSRHEERWVLRGINLDIKKGESVGLIGENGSGKSTLLKILSKILYPNSGSVSLSGRVSSLLELGAGFHPDLSGRENIYNNASVFGLDEKEIDKRLSKIIDFSELHDFIDNPVRTYSSGMYMRLAFSVAINVDADILLIDEILAVGDANFQRKCFNMLREIKSRGTTIVIVSHSLGQIEQFCDRSVWLEDGIIRMDGTPRQVHAEYLDFMDQRVREEAAHNEEAHKTLAEVEPEPEQPDEEDADPDAENEESEPENPYETDKNRFGNFDIVFDDVSIYGRDQKETTVFTTGDPLLIKMKYHIQNDVPADDVVIGIGLIRNDGTTAYGTNTFVDFGHSVTLQKQGEIECSIPSNTLLNGLYSLDIALESISGFPYDYYKNAIEFEMVSRINDVGFMRLEHEWTLDGDILDEE